MPPKVSFVIPCYKLAHLLSDCINSILSQTYEDFEILIMDDCSPDHTTEVAQSFCDPRVKHIRNEPNLGHLRNYNKGIELAHGKYVWLISADDYLRRPYILERYVQVMEKRPKVGYVFCPAMKVQNSRETEVVDWGFHGIQDVVFTGHDFLRKLLIGNCVVAPTGMVRKECYDKVSLFPLDMPHIGDWYLWCVFALHYDVAYFAEPMVNYRTHDLSMSRVLQSRNPRMIIGNWILARWRLREKMKEVRENSLRKKCEETLVSTYASWISNGKYENSGSGVTLEDFEQSLLQYAQSRKEQSHIRALVLLALGDQYYLRRDFQNALRYYQTSIQQKFWMLETWGKYVLLQTGDIGVCFRDSLAFLRRMAF